MSTVTAAEVAADLRTTSRTITRLAGLHGIGLNLGGRAGFRFEAEDIKRLKDVLRPAPAADAEDTLPRHLS